MDLREQVGYDEGYRRGYAIGKATAAFRLCAYFALMLVVYDVSNFEGQSIVAIVFGVLAVESWFDRRKLKRQADQ